MKERRQISEERCQRCRRFSPSRRVGVVSDRVNGWCMKHRRAVRWNDTCAEFEDNRSDEFYNVPVLPVTIFTGD